MLLKPSVNLDSLVYTSSESEWELPRGKKIFERICELGKREGVGENAW